MKKILTWAAIASFLIINVLYMISLRAYTRNALAGLAEAIWDSQHESAHVSSVWSLEDRVEALEEVMGSNYTSLAENDIYVLEDRINEIEGKLQLLSDAMEESPSSDDLWELWDYIYDIENEVEFLRGILEE